MTSIAVRPARRTQTTEEPEWIVWALVALMLLAGLALRTWIEGRTQPYNQAGVTLSYPAAWTPSTGGEPTQVLHVGDGLSSSAFPTHLRVRQMPATEVARNLQSLGDLALAWSADQANQLPNYAALNVEPVTVNGSPAIALDYAYVASPVLGGGSANVPVVARAQDLLFLHEGTLTVVTFAAEQGEYDQASPTWARIRSSLRLGGR